MTDKETILELWRQVKRSGIDKLINWLTQSDFFEAPCSTKYHLSIPGGLAIHSLNTFKLLSQKVKEYKLEKLIPEDTMIVTSLGHDLCKVGVYVKDTTEPTSKQIDYLKKLSSEEFVNYEKEKLTKSYVSSLIEWYKSEKSGNKPENGYVFQENFPLGHGEKSVSILQKFIELTEAEALAIRWHMALFDPAVRIFKYPIGYAFEEAIKKYILVQLFMLVDFEVSSLVEKTWTQ